MIRNPRTILRCCVLAVAFAMVLVGASMAIKNYVLVAANLLTAAVNIWLIFRISDGFRNLR